MLGAIIGDIVGSRFEFNNTNRTDFELLHKDCSFTDDTICTVAIADALIRKIPYKDALLEWCRKYPNPMGGYGVRFAQWIASDNPQPYNSYGNGSAMRVSPVAWSFNNLSKVLEEAEKTALPTHNHPEGIRGAIAVAHSIWHFRNGGDLSGFVDIANKYYPNPKPAKLGVFDETCAGVMPVAFNIVYNSNSLEGAIRKAVAYGGDSDTLAAIVGSIAEARWGVPWQIAERAFRFIPRTMQQIIRTFYDVNTPRTFYLRRI